MVGLRTFALARVAKLCEARPLGGVARMQNLLISAAIVCWTLACASQSLACNVPPFVGPPPMEGETADHYERRMAQIEARQKAEAKRVLRSESTSIFRARISRIHLSRMTSRQITFAPVSLLEGSKAPERIRSGPLDCGYPIDWKVGDLVVVYAAFDTSMRAWKVLEVETAAEAGAAR